MRARGPAGEERLSVRRRGGTALVLAAAVFVLAPGWVRPRAAASPQEPREDQAGGRLSLPYTISAHLFILGNWGDVGTMTIESALRREDGRLEKSLRLAGSSNEEMVKKRNKDFRGDFSLLKVLPLRADGSVDEEAVREGRDVESSSSGFLKLNKKYQAERIAFFPDHAVATREDGTEKRVEGSFGNIISPLEYLMEHDLRVGQAVELPFILNGVPRLFRLEVRDLVTLTAYKSRAYVVDLWAKELVAGKETAPKDVWRKKGNVRLWFCKDGPLAGRLLRLKIKFRWYLWLYFDLVK